MYHLVQMVPEDLQADSNHSLNWLQLYLGHPLWLPVHPLQEQSLNTSEKMDSGLVKAEVIHPTIKQRNKA